MLILVSQLVGRPVIGFNEAEEIGVLREPIIEPTNGKIVGYFVGHGLFHLKTGVILADDIVGYENNRLIVQGLEEAGNIDSQPAINKVLKKKTAVLGAKVLTESGQHLGRAGDLLLDTELQMVVRYYVTGLLQDRIIPAEQVIRVEKRGIIVDDSSVTVVPKTAGVEAEPAG